MSHTLNVADTIRILDEPPLRYLVRDFFSEAEAAPLASPRTADHEGYWDVEQDADDDFKIVAGHLQKDQHTAFADSWLAVSDSGGTPIPLTPRAGMACFLGEAADTLTKMMAGFAANVASANGMWSGSGGVALYARGLYSAGMPGSSWDDGDDLAIVLRNYGAYLLRANGELLWVMATTWGVDPMYGMVSGTVAADQDLVSQVAYARLPGSPTDAIQGNHYDMWGHRDLDISEIFTFVANGPFDHTMDCYVSAVLTTMPTVSNTAIWLSASDYGAGAPNDGLYLRPAPGSNNLQVYKRIGGAAVEALGQINAVLSDGCTIQAVLTADKFIVGVDNTIHATYTDILDVVRVAEGYVVDDDVVGAWGDIISYTLDGTGNHQFPVEELLTDGDMEAADTSAYSALNGATLTKESTDPYEGTQCLRVAYNGFNSPIAAQSVLRAGEWFLVTGRARSDGNVAPEIRGDSAAQDDLWVGTTSTDWQEIFVAFESTTSTAVWLLARCVGAGQYCEFDDMCVTRINPYAVTPVDGSELLADGDMEAVGVGDWSAGLSATLTKETTDPYEGAQCLRVAYNGTANPYAYQSILTAGERYRITGAARGDGVVAPRIISGSNLDETLLASTDWQLFSFTWVADNAVLGLRIVAAAAGYAEFDDVSVVQIPADTNCPGYGIATAVLPGPRTLTQYCTHEAGQDGVNIEFVVDALPSAGSIVTFFGYQDDLNGWYIDVTSGGYLFVREYIAGVATIRINAGAVISGGERLILKWKGDTMALYYELAGTLNLAGTYSSAATYLDKTTVKIHTLGTAGEMSNLITRPSFLYDTALTPSAPRAGRAITLLGQ